MKVFFHVNKAEKVVKPHKKFSQDRVVDCLTDCDLAEDGFKCFCEIFRLRMEINKKPSKTRIKESCYAAMTERL